MRLFFLVWRRGCLALVQCRTTAFTTHTQRLTCLRLLSSDSARANTVKTKVVTTEPQTLLNNIEQVTKDTGNSKLMAIKPEQHMTTFKGRG